MHQRYAIGVLLAAAILAAAGCDRSPHGQYGGEVGGMTISAAGVFGGANVNVNVGMCAGRVVLVQGEATVQDRCFTGDTNVVLCTDATSANPIKCSPGNGTLAIAGTGSDVISYARIR